MHSFTGTLFSLIHFECECGFSFEVPADTSPDEIRKQIHDHRQDEIFKEGNSYRNPRGDELTES